MSWLEMGGVPAEFGMVIERWISPFVLVIGGMRSMGIMSGRSVLICLAQTINRRVVGRRMASAYEVHNDENDHGNCNSPKD